MCPHFVEIGHTLFSVTDAWLVDSGFPLQGVLDTSTLPGWIVAPLRSAGIDLARHRRLVMLGQAGSSTWDAMQAAGLTGADRFDDYSIAVARDYARRLGAHVRVVYPAADVVLPLGRMAEHVGWGRPSPLGLTIHDRYGPWIAHRVVFLIDAALPLSTDSTTHPCSTCADTPCVTACPAGAVSLADGFDVDSCSQFRVRPGSPCAERCMARLACPIGVEYRYPPDQMRHHYRAGLLSIRRFYG